MRAPRLLLVVVLAVFAAGDCAPLGLADAALAQTTDAQRRRDQRKPRAEPPPAAVQPGQGLSPLREAREAQGRDAQAAAGGTSKSLPREKVEADVSTRTIAVTSGFTGTEIIVFGSVDNSRQTSAEAGYYDVAIVIEGVSTPLTARKKSNVAGLWVNTQAARFESVPSYYAIASTRPIEEIADAAVLEQNAIGLDYVRLSPTAKSAVETAPPDLKAFKQAVVRVKQKDGLYLKDDYAVAFIGRSLFRSSISLPANIPVGQLSARVYLFHEGELLSTFSTRVQLEREGVELWLYRFAMKQPLLYGLFSVFVAVGAGLLASMAFRRNGK